MSKLKVFVTRSDFPRRSIDLLEKKFQVECYPFPKAIEEDYLMQHVRGSSAIYCLSTDKITSAVLDAAGPQLKIVATFSLGFEHIDVEECKRRNIYVCNAPNLTSISCVAEFTVSLLLAVARRIVESTSSITRGEWKGWSPDWYCGRGLTDATVGIVGMGRIGQAVMDRVLPFGVSSVYYYDVVGKIPSAEAKGARYLKFDDLLKKSDYVIAMCNLTEESKGIFNSRAFSLMKSDAVFINTSRGGVVDQTALIDALKNRKIRAAGIDVMYPEPLPENHELTTLQNIVITPHIAAAESTAMETLGTITAENIIAVLENRVPRTPVFSI